MFCIFFLFPTNNRSTFSVPSSFSEVTLNDYLRNHVHLTGTKVMCREGGCGACIVHVAYPDPSAPKGTGNMVQHSVNSVKFIFNEIIRQISIFSDIFVEQCLCPILSCDGWEITTVEGLGDQINPHVIQTRLTENYGTQCGYCKNLDFPALQISMLFI